MANLWDKIGDKVHLGLGGLGMIPAVGNIADVIDAGLYTLEGDKLGAGLSLAAAVPGMGLIAGGTKLAKGAKNLKKAEKLADVKKLKGPESRSIYKKGENSILDEVYAEDQFKTARNKMEADFVKSGDLIEITDDSARLAKEALKKELFTPESYGKWAKMMDAEQSIRVKQLESLFAPQQIIDQAKANQAKMFGKRHYDYYKNIINETLDKTKAYKVPAKSKAHDPDAQGWFSSVTKNVYLSENAADAGSTLIHEFKHAAQNPFKGVMNKVLEGPFRKSHKEFIKTLDPKDQLVRNMDPKAIKRSDYITEPIETSARLSEIRGANLGYDSKRAISELEEVYTPEKIDWLKKNIWAAAPIGVMTSTDRINKIFGEEE